MARRRRTPRVVQVLPPLPQRTREITTRETVRLTAPEGSTNPFDALEQFGQRIQDGWIVEEMTVTFKRVEYE